MTTDIKAVLFDNDGTLMDTYWGIMESYKLMMKNLFNEDNPDIEAYAKLIGLPLQAQFERYTDDPDLVQKMVDDYRSYHSRLKLNDVEPFDGIAQMLADLYNAGYTLGIVTSKIRKTCIAALENCGLWQYFSYLQSADDWPVHKPDPGALTHACEELKLNPENVMYVGDSPYDMQAASGADCKTCGVTYGKFFSRKDLQAENPTIIIDHPSELADLLA